MGTQEATYNKRIYFKFEIGKYNRPIFWGIHSRYGLEFFMSKSINVYLKEWTSLINGQHFGDGRCPLMREYTIIVQYKMNDHLTLSLLISILRRNFDSIISFLRTIL
ncbi:hypothetical protein NQ317_011610 [Molorchus minor]|uniref:Uncharacterized protein n=1 Tax=Molorchus minor TaxID=1323400 RepID=A0ABQ9J7F9_9CUCU|nr:hypothetical protein NQ317_011610 [Molorchus minor]